MSRFAASVAWSALVLATLTGCGKSPYCQAVEDHQVALNSLGEEKTTAAYTQYEQAFQAVTNVAPAGIRKDWLTLTNVIEGVLAAHRSAGIKLEEMSSTNPKLASRTGRATWWARSCTKLSIWPCGRENPTVKDWASGLFARRW